MSVFVAGIGAVTPAGWSVAEAAAAVRDGVRIEPQVFDQSGWEGPLRLKVVPPPRTRYPFLAHARLRRASPLSHYAAGACLEALGGAGKGIDCTRLGLVSCLQSGPVQYACRFYEELLRDPATASPVLFPETVFSAPASHVAALLGGVPCATTMLGDPGAFLHGVAMAAGWIEDGRVDYCLVFGAEEFNRIHANAFWHLDSASTLGAGAGAVLLTRHAELPAAVELEFVTDAHTYSGGRDAAEAAKGMRAQFGAQGVRELLCDSLGGALRLHRAEADAWKDWAGARLSPKGVLGEGLMAGSAWQTVLAIDRVLQGEFDAANVSVVGVNQQAIGARFCVRGRNLT